jgi:hypothetical protein
VGSANFIWRAIQKWEAPFAIQLKACYLPEVIPVCPPNELGTKHPITYARKQVWGNILFLMKDPSINTLSQVCGVVRPCQTISDIAARHYKGVFASFNYARGIKVDTISYGREVYKQVTICGALPCDYHKEVHLIR